MLLCPQAAGELVDLQKVSAVADGCVFSGLRAGSLYRLQVVSWSRDMSSDSSTLARTGELARQRAEIQNETLVEVLRVRGSDRIQFLSGYFGFLFVQREEVEPRQPSLCKSFLMRHVLMIFSCPSCLLLFFSPVFGVVSGGSEFRTDGQTDGQLAAWRGQVD